MRRFTQLSWILLAALCGGTASFLFASGSGTGSSANAAPAPAIESEAKDLLFGTSGQVKARVVRISVDLALGDLLVHSAPSGAQLPDMAEPGALAVMNGGYFDKQFAPVGWLRDRRGLIHGKAAMNRGGVLAISKGRAYIGTAGSMPFPAAKTEFALWSFPLLVRHPGESGMRGDDGKRAPRTIACIKATDAKNPTAGSVDFLMVLSPMHDGPTLFEAAEALRKPAADGGFGCTAALNLDGGPSTGVWLPENGNGHPSDLTALNRAPIGYAISVVAKKSATPSAK